MAEPHLGARFMLRMDIHNFFGSIHSDRINLLLRRRGVSIRLNRDITKFCFLPNNPGISLGALPQGGVTSPYLSNILGFELDREITNLLSRWRTVPKADRGHILRLEAIVYTRYADDLVFSSNYPFLWAIKGQIERVLGRQGLNVNPIKTVSKSRSSRLSVCGVVVNDILSKSRIYRYNLKAKLHNLIMGRVCGTLDPDVEIPWEKILGQVNHINDINALQGDKLSKLAYIAQNIQLDEPEWTQDTKDYVHGRRIRDTSDAGARQGHPLEGATSTESCNL